MTINKLIGLWKRIKNGTFTCSLCEKKFTSYQSERELKKQYKVEFPYFTFNKNDVEKVCDDCFKKMNKKIPTKTLKPPTEDYEYKPIKSKVGFDGVKCYGKSLTESILEKLVDDKNAKISKKIL